MSDPPPMGSREAHARDLRIVKRHKRLWIEDGAGQTVYTPPDFLLPLGNRESLDSLAERMSTAVHPIDEIIAFETRMSRKSERRSRR